MDERKEEQHQPQDDTRPPEAQDPEAVEDLDVPEGESDDVKGGTYSFKQGWPKKYSG